MTGAAVVLLAALNPLVPVGREIDCGSWAGVESRMTVRCVAADGSKLEFLLAVHPTTTLRDVTESFEDVTDDTGWTAERAGRGVVRVYGPGRGGVLALDIRSDGWAPQVRPVFGKVRLPQPQK